MIKRKNRDCKHFTSTTEFVPNKCGSLEGVAKFTYHLIPDFILGQDCNCHDYAYFFGGCKMVSDKARFLADKEFYINMQERINALGIDCSWYLKPFYATRRTYYKGIIWSYYKFVRKFGHKSFNWFDTPFQWSGHLIKHSYDTTFLSRYMERKTK